MACAGPRFSSRRADVVRRTRERSSGSFGRWSAERRLVTITGAGGCGKTRLAIEVLGRRRASASGCRCVGRSAAVGDPGRVVDAVAGGRRRAGRTGSGPDGGARPPAARPRAARRHRQLRAPARRVARGSVDAVFRGCRRLPCSPPAGSRSASPGETVWRVPSMAEEEVVALFVERARAARPTSSSTPPTATPSGRVCRRLDGVPLAVELAAAWVRILTPAQIAGRARRPVPALLVGGPDGRRPPADADGIGGSGATRSSTRRPDAAATVVGVRRGLRPGRGRHGYFADEPSEGEALTALRRLVDASMLEADDRGGSPLPAPRHHPLLRRRPPRGVRRHRRVARCAPRLLPCPGVERSRRLEIGDQDDVLARLEIEHDNFRAALQWSWHGAGPRAGAAGRGVGRPVVPSRPRRRGAGGAAAGDRPARPRTRPAVAGRSVERRSRCWPCPRGGSS